MCCKYITAHYGLDHSLTDFQVSLSELESVSGLTFFPNLPAIHPMCSSACLTALESILACPSPLVSYCSHPHYNKPLV